MSMVEMKVSELSGAALDWAVAIAVDQETTFDGGGKMRFGESMKLWEPSTRWSVGGPLIADYKMDFDHLLGGKVRAEPMHVIGRRHATGPTHLIAGMRAIVAINEGDTVYIPSELTEPSHD